MLRLLCLLACAAAQTNFTAHVVVACDAHQFQGLGAVLHSVAAAAGASAPRLAFTVVVPEADAATAARLAACAVGGSGASARVVAVERTGAARLQIPGYDDFAASSPEEAARQAAKRAKYGRLGSRLNYARFFLDELLPADAATALYVDVDAVVHCDAVALLRDALPRLEASRPDRGGAVAAVDRGGTAAAPRRRLFRRGPSSPSFNAGVFAADLGRWRAAGATARLVAAMAEAAASVRRNGTTFLSRPSSQAPMVRVFGADFLPLDPRWNRVFHDHERDAPPRDVAATLAGAAPPADCVWHFTGGRKPWDDDPATSWARRAWAPHGVGRCLS